MSSLRPRGHRDRCLQLSRRGFLFGGNVGYQRLRASGAMRLIHGAIPVRGISCSFSHRQSLCSSTVRSAVQVRRLPAAPLPRCGSRRHSAQERTSSRRRLRPTTVAAWRRWSRVGYMALYPAERYAQVNAGLRSRSPICSACRRSLLFDRDNFAGRRSVLPGRAGGPLRRRGGCEGAGGRRGAMSLGVKCVSSRTWSVLPFLGGDVAGFGGACIRSHCSSWTPAGPYCHDVVVSRLCVCRVRDSMPVVLVLGT